jgi:hypothetical protein
MAMNFSLGDVRSLLLQNKSSDAIAILFRGILGIWKSSSTRPVPGELMVKLRLAAGIARDNAIATGVGGGQLY